MFVDQVTATDHQTQPHPHRHLLKGHYSSSSAFYTLNHIHRTNERTNDNDRARLAFVWSVNCDYTETDRNQSKLPLPGVDASIAFASLHSDVTRNFCFCCCCGYCNSQYPIQHTQGGRAGRTTTDCAAAAAATTPPTTTRTNEHAQLIIIIIIIGSYAVQLHTPCQLLLFILLLLLFRLRCTFSVDGGSVGQSLHTLLSNSIRYPDNTALEPNQQLHR